LSLNTYRSLILELIRRSRSDLDGGGGRCRIDSKLWLDIMGNLIPRPHQHRCQMYGRNIRGFFGIGASVRTIVHFLRQPLRGRASKTAQYNKKPNTPPFAFHGLSLSRYSFLSSRTLIRIGSGRLAFGIDGIRAQLWPRPSPARRVFWNWMSRISMCVFVFLEDLSFPSLRSVE
jgi:hypothetical protein